MNKQGHWYHPDFDNDLFVPSDTLVTSVRVQTIGGHDHVTLWNRGGNAGTLIVNKGDGEEIARRLLPVSHYKEP